VIYEGSVHADLALPGMSSDEETALRVMRFEQRVDAEGFQGLRAVRFFMDSASPSRGITREKPTPSNALMHGLSQKYAVCCPPKFQAIALPLRQ